MTSVHQFVGHAKFDCCPLDASQIKLIVKPTYEDQPMRSNFQNFFTANGSSSLPISKSTALPPSRSQFVGFPDLISQIHADNSGVVLVSPCEFFGRFKEFVLRILMTPPESIPIVIATAPLGGTGVVIENDHESDISEGFHGDIEYFHGSFADEFRVGLEVLVRNNFVVVEQLHGVSETNAVHLELVPDVQGNIPHGTALQTVHAVPAHVSARPVSARQFDSSPSRIHDSDVGSREGEGDVLDVEERPLLDEIAGEILVALHEFLVDCLVHVSHMEMKYLMR